MMANGQHGQAMACFLIEIMGVKQGRSWRSNTLHRAGLAAPSVADTPPGEADVRSRHALIGAPPPSASRSCCSSGA